MQIKQLIVITKLIHPTLPPVSAIIMEETTSFRTALFLAIATRQRRRWRYGQVRQILGAVQQGLNIGDHAERRRAPGLLDQGGQFPTQRQVLLGQGGIFRR